VIPASFYRFRSSHYCNMHRQRVQPWNDAVDCPQWSPYTQGKDGNGGAGDGGLPRGGVCLRCCASLSPTNQLMVRRPSEVRHCIICISCQA